MKITNILFRIDNTLIDRLTGFDIKHEIENAVKFDFLPKDRISKYQQSKFQELSRIASKSEYYKDFSDKPLKEFPLISRE